MTPSSRSRRGPVQFGLLRMLVAMSPGFGSGVLMALLSERRSPLFCPDPVWIWTLVGAGAVVLVLVFAWLDALLNPSIPKPGGHPSPGTLGISAAWFLLGQIFALPVLFAVTAGLGHAFFY